MKDKGKPKLTKEQRNLIASYKKLTWHTIHDLNSSEILDEQKFIEISEFLKNYRDQLELPLFHTCKDYYDDGLKSMQIGYFIDFFISAIFGASIGLLTSVLSEYPNYLIIALITASVSLFFVLIYSIIKKFKSKI